MGVALRAASARADAIFKLAEQISGQPIGTLCAEGPLDKLTRTDIAQIAVVATSLAAAARLEEALGGPISAIAVAGHSVGELAALCVAGAISAETALALVHERGTLMQRDSAACDGTMVAVLDWTPTSLTPSAVKRPKTVTDRSRLRTSTPPARSF